MIPVNVILSAVLFLNALISAVFAVFSLTRRKSDSSALSFFFLLLFSSIYITGNGFLLQASDIQSIFRCICFEYVGIAFLPSCFFALAVNFSPAREKFLARLLPFAFALSALILIAVCTNDLHHLYYTDIKLDESSPFPSAVLHRGPLSLVKTIFYMCGMVFAIVQYFRRAYDSGNIDLSRMLLLIVPFALGIVVQFVALSGIVPWSLDIVPFFIVLINGIFAWGVLGKDLFEIRSLARKLVFNAMDEAVFVLLPDREIIDWNPAVFSFFPKADANLSGKRLDSISPQLSQFCDTLTVGSSGEFEISDGNAIKSVSVHSLLISGKRRRKHGTALVLRDITETKRHLSLLEEIAIHDGLTGCFNRRHWITLAETEFARAKRNGRHLSIIMIDVDHFKVVNDTWGHAMGDSVLVALTGSLSLVLRSTDFFGRIGGEEFAIILPETDLATASLIAERLRSVAESTATRLENIAVSITISLGMTSLSLADLSFAAMLRRADDALYRAKGNGRNRVEII
jgi:diguanylate cyclase (GGDEF)-like protein